MKKRLLMAVVVSGMIMGSIVTGCGKKEAPQPTNNTVTVQTVESSEQVKETEAETTVEETTTLEAVSEKEPSDDYLSWTGKDWKNASSEEKENASRYYLIESTKATAKAAGQDFTREMEAAITPEMVSSNVTVLEAAFSADETIKLEDLLDMTVNAANAMMESAMQQTP